MAMPTRDTSASRADLATEQTPLLASEGHRNGQKPAWPAPKTSERNFRARAELTSLAWLAVPLTLSNVLEHTLSTAAVFWVVKIGMTSLAAASLASLTINVTSFSIIQGVAAALDTLCPAAFASERPSDTSLHAMRSGLIMLLLMVPQCLFIWNAEPIFLLLHQDPTIAHMTAGYLRVMAFAIPGFGVFEILRKYVVSQGRAEISTVIVAIMAPLNLLLNWLFVWRWCNEPWLNGAAYATTLSMNLMALAMLVSTVCFVPRTGWGGLRRDVFKDWKENIDMGLDGVLSVASEWWIFELCSLAASFLGAEHFATQSVLLILGDTFYNAALAASTAASVRVGAFVGGHHPKHARYMARVALCVGVGLGVVSAVVLYVARHPIAEKLSNEALVRDLVLSTMPLVCVFVLLDATSAVAEGVLRGAERPGTAATCSFASYYIVAVPIAAFLTFGPPKMGLAGLWIGLIAAVALETVVLYIVGLHSDMKAAEKEELMKEPDSLLSSRLHDSMRTPRTPLW